MNDKEAVSKKFIELIQIFKIGVMKPMEKKFRNTMPSTGSHILFYIINNGSCTMGDITRIMSCSKQQATQMVDKLIKNGYVQRQTDKDDRRKVWISVTDNGKQLVKEIEKILETSLIENFSIFDKNELENLQKAIEIFEYSFKKIQSSIKTE